MLAATLAGCGSPIELPAPPSPAPAPPPAPPPPTPVTTVAPPTLVGIPWNVHLSAKDRAVDLTWNLVNGAQSYRVEWEADARPLPSFDPQSGAYEHTGLAPELRYRYAVTSGLSPTTVSAVPKERNADADLPTPVWVSIAPDLRTNTISWDAVADASEYRLYWSLLPNVTASNGTRVALDGSLTTYSHTQLSPGVPYYYMVTAANSVSGESEASAEVSAAPGQPQGVTLTAREGQVNLVWPSDPEASVSVSPSKVVPVQPYPAFPLVFGNLENDRQYAFSIHPLFADGFGPSSATLYAVPKAVLAGVPKRVTLRAERDVNTVSWEAVTGAPAYDVSWIARDLDGTPLAGTTTVTDTTFRHIGLRLCTNPADDCPIYTYRIRASQSAIVAPEVGARAVDLRPVPPLITNTDYVLITGTKPAGSRVEIDGASVTPLDHESAWVATLPLDGVTDRLFTFVFRLASVAADGRRSTETVYRVTRDLEPPKPLEHVTVTACDAPSTTPRRITLVGAVGSKDPGTAVFRVREPDAADVQIVGATNSEEWTGVLDLDDQPASIGLIAKDSAGNASTPSLTISLSSCPP